MITDLVKCYFVGFLLAALLVAPCGVIISFRRALSLSLPKD